MSPTRMALSTHRTVDEILSSDVWSEVKQAVRWPAVGLMIYGSVARGAERSDSDIDVLQLVDGEAVSYSVGRVNFTAYSRERLRKYCSSGSLFARHLHDEGLIVLDDDGVLREIVDSYSPPDGYEDLKATLRFVSDSGRVSDVDEYGQRLTNLVSWGARSAIYIHLAELGFLTFDLDEACDRVGYSGLASLIRSRDVSVIPKLVNVIEDIVSRSDRRVKMDMSSLALHALRDNALAAILLERVIAGSEELSYSALPLPLC